MTTASEYDARFRCNVLGDNAREYVLRTDRALLDLADLFYLLVVVATAAVLGNSDWTWVMCGVIIVYWVWSKCNIVKEESILSIRDVGVQVKTVYTGGRVVSRFIDRSDICDIVINEGITMLQVKFYLAIIVEAQDRMVVVFEHLLPKLNPVLIQVYRGVRAILFKESDGPVDSMDSDQDYHEHDL
ncbi:hypothetical protein BC938DRAFT_471534 [Jimgerdemannia flammicorona]|uniref:Phosphatidylinositol N-acetylglucosaminyltransferase subunit H conserved domain-containing protein n=1 Tax=Jimgerdemannia flammicorona TaxID=994334 RepID=A0A433Q7Y8_9FUNG|nr:hypothetical protein BC938DRAFT_471534 [Jimgerdemannia flammicorona]